MPEVAEQSVDAAVQEAVAKLQSSYDRKYSELQTKYDEERVINDDMARSLTEMREELKGLRDRGYENDDPEVRELRSQMEKAKEEAATLKRQMAQMQPYLKSAVITEQLYELYPGRSEKAKTLRAQAKDFLSQAKSRAEVDQRVKELQALTSNFADDDDDDAAPSGRQSRSAEFDAGRGSGRGGEPEITRELLAEKHGDFEWWEKNRSRIDAWAGKQ